VNLPTIPQSRLNITLSTPDSLNLVYSHRYQCSASNTTRPVSGQGDRRQPVARLQPGRRRRLSGHGHVHGAERGL